MTLRPLGDRVLIAPLENRTESQAGLALVEHWKPEQMGTVIAVGTPAHPLTAEAASLAKRLGPSDAALVRRLLGKAPVCAPGDLVLFSWQAGQEVQDHDTDTRYLLLKTDDLIAVIEKDTVPA